MKVPFGRIGGKKLLKNKIIKMFPTNYQHMRYVEPFVGAGHVLYGKQPSTEEIINDKDYGIYLLHTGLKEYSKELSGRYIMTKYEFDIWKKNQPSSKKDEFMREWILTKYSYSGCKITFNKGHGEQFPATMLDYSERLKDVIIHNEDYKEIIMKYDGENTLFYFDPPYDDSKRTSGYTYYTFSLEDMKLLIDKLKGKFILTYNDGDHVRELFKNYNMQYISIEYKLPKPHIGYEVIISNF